MAIVLKGTGFLALLYLVYCSYLFVMQRQVLFPIDLIETYPGSVPNTTGLEKLWINTDFGKVEAWFIPSAQKATPAPAAIFAHGNGELIDFWPAPLKPLTELGISLLLVEYPGYGRSNGTPSQDSILETFINAYDVLISRQDVDPDKIILMGRSVGGGAVCTISDKRKSAAMILISTFISVKSFAKSYYLPGFLIRDPFDNISAIRTYTSPILVIHGKHDEIIPHTHGMALSKAAKIAKLITYESGHNDCPPNWKRFYQDIGSFLHENGIL